MRYTIAGLTITKSNSSYGTWAIHLERHVQFFWRLSDAKQWAQTMHGPGY